MNSPNETHGVLWRQLGCMAVMLLLAGAMMALIGAIGYQDNWVAVLATTLVGGFVIIWIVNKLFGGGEQSGG
jgi:hypothetical protein